MILHYPMTDLQAFVWNEVNALLGSREGNKPVLGLAVSGGTDSRALLELMRTYPAELHIIHVNHGLRPSSGDEAEEVSRLANHYEMEFHLYQYSLADYENLPSNGLEAQARALRYRAFEDWLSRGDRVMLLGHHADDQAETVLLHMFRGTHVTGLRGMAKLRGKYLRPLLGIRRKSLESYLAIHGIIAIEDESNQELSMTRNRIRHEVMPLLEDVFKRDPVAMILRTAMTVEEDQNLLEHLIEELYGQYLIGQNGIYRVTSDVRPEILRALLHRVLPRRDLKRQHYLDMVELLQQREFKSIDLPHYVFATGWSYYTWADNLNLAKSKLEGKVREDYPQVQADHLQDIESTLHDHWELLIERKQGPVSPWHLQVDDVLYCELEWKTLEILDDRQIWRQKLKKWGVPAPVRERLPLCFHGDELVWVPGFRSERPRAGDICLFWNNLSSGNTI